jgi:hypothetical protein
MPGARDKLERRAGRSFSVHAGLTLPESGPMHLVTLIEPHDDGLEAHEVVAGPGARLLDQTAAGSGRYQLVLEGSLLVDGLQLEPYSVAFAAPGRRFSRRLAGPEGVRLLELQVPTA